MEVTRIGDAKPYMAPKHFDMQALRLQGFEASASKFCWVGLSHFLPGGGAEMDTSPLEKVYVVLEGEVTVELENGERQVLRPLDSCYIPGGEGRKVVNESNLVVTMLVMMPYPEAKK